MSLENQITNLLRVTGKAVDTREIYSIVTNGMRPTRESVNSALRKMYKAGKIRKCGQVFYGDGVWVETWELVE